MSSVDLTNTPGYYYAVAYWISEVRLIILFRNSRSRMEVEMLQKTLQMQYDNYKIAEEIMNGDPVTTKQDTAYHGFGVKSIRATAAKYGGTTNLTVKEGWFRVSILFPPEVFEKE